MTMKDLKLSESTPITVGVFLILAGALISVGAFMGSSAAQGQAISEIQERLATNEKNGRAFREKYAETNERFAVTLEGIRGDVKVLLERTRDTKAR